MKRSRNCVECGSSEIYTKRTIRGQLAGLLLPDISAPYVEIYVCVSCGNHQIVVPNLFLAEVAKKYEKHT